MSKLRVLNVRIRGGIYKRRNRATYNVRMFDFLWSLFTNTPRIQKFLRLNYSFSLTENVALDSHAVGNETRYLNHSENPNCDAKGQSLRNLKSSEFDNAI